MPAPPSSRQRWRQPLARSRAVVNYRADQTSPAPAAHPMTDATLRYTPYDGSRQPFSIGLNPLDLADWFEPDDRLLDELTEKDRLFATRRDVVFRAEAETRDAQSEVLDLIADWLPARHPHLYRRDQADMVVGDRHRVALDTDAPPLWTAARLVQDDLVLMRNSPQGWRLVAASLSFPSAWSLAEKMSLPMDAIHAHVPHFPGKMGERVARIFDNLRVELPVWRLNWSIYDDAVLHHPESKQGPRAWAGEHGQFGESAFIRVERQTLRKLPVCGDILFTIRIYVDPVGMFRAHPRGAELATGLRAQLLALDEGQLRYKGLLADREKIATELDRLTAASG
jgi:dimethylamine monooxygenase subunit A